MYVSGWCFSFSGIIAGIKKIWFFVTVFFARQKPSVFLWGNPATSPRRVRESPCVRQVSSDAHIPAGTMAFAIENSKLRLGSPPGRLPPVAPQNVVLHQAAPPALLLACEPALSAQKLHYAVPALADLVDGGRIVVRLVVCFFCLFVLFICLLI